MLAKAFHVSVPIMLNILSPSVRYCKTVEDNRLLIDVTLTLAAFRLFLPTPGDPATKCALILTTSWRYVNH